jgi:hypothetical protein
VFQPERGCFSDEESAMIVDLKEHRETALLQI